MQSLCAKYAIIIVIYRKNHPLFPLHCYPPSKHIERTLPSSDYSQFICLYVSITTTDRFVINGATVFHEDIAAQGEYSPILAI